MRSGTCEANTRAPTPFILTALLAFAISLAFDEVLFLSISLRKGTCIQWHFLTGLQPWSGIVTASNLLYSTGQPDIRALVGDIGADLWHGLSIMASKLALSDIRHKYVYIHICMSAPEAEIKRPLHAEHAKHAQATPVLQTFCPSSWPRFAAFIIPMHLHPSFTSYD